MPSRSLPGVTVLFSLRIIFLFFYKPLSEPGLNLIELDNTILIVAASMGDIFLKMGGKLFNPSLLHFPGLGTAFFSVRYVPFFSVL